MNEVALSPALAGTRGTWTLVTAAVAAVMWFTRESAGWLAMWVIAAAEFAVLKLATLDGLWRKAGISRVVGYLLLWPGLNARAFLCGDDRAARGDTKRAPLRELAFAAVKLALGIAFTAWATTHAHGPHPLLVAWIGMFGIIFTLHFGAMHVLSWLWRRAGIDAPPLMHAPIASTSLAELWAERWNTAFADAARRFVLRPLARRAGVRLASVAVFLVSGLLHETVISWPARGGWGGPTAYFLLQAGGMAVEKSAFGTRLRLGRGFTGWIWTFFVAVAPLPLLFHAAFARNVIVPFFHAIANTLLP